MRLAKLPVPPATNRRRTILVVEDHADWARLIARVIDRGGFEPVLAYSAHAARRNSAAMPLAGATVDLEMPDATGFELIPELRERRPGLPIIVVTTYFTEEYASKATALGAHILGKGCYELGLTAWLERVRTHAAISQELIALVGELADEHNLPDRQRDVLRLAVTALSRKQIASHLGVTVSAVQSTFQRIEASLGRNMTGIVEGLRAEAMALARQRHRCGP